MQIYIIGIGQCGTSVAFDVISELTGFVKSKEVKTLPQRGGDVEAARNDLEKRLTNDFTRTERWKTRIGSWMGRLFNDGAGRKAFIVPKIAIIDGNPNNFVKTAFQTFAGAVVLDSSGDEDLEQLVNLITNTQVLGFNNWASGCANGLVGEEVTASNLSPGRLQNNLGVDNLGNLAPPALFPVSVFLVVSSAGGSTGSGGGVYLAQSDALLANTSAMAGANAQSHTIVANAIILPSIEASSDNKKYALNAGRALARHGNMITKQRNNGERRDRPSTTILFSNPPDEGDSRALQRLNNYLAEFAIRVANFTFPGNVARIARDVDERELRYLRSKTSVVAMSHLEPEHWGEEELESKLVERAFANIYESRTDKPHGLSAEDQPRSGVDDAAPMTSSASSAMVAIGMPRDFLGPLSLSIAKINEYLKEHSGSPLRSGIRTFAYGAGKNLELTVFLRYRTMSACALAMHFVRQYVNAPSGAETPPLSERDYIVGRAERDDDYAETFEELAAELSELDGQFEFEFELHPPEEPRSGASVASETAE